MGDLDNHVADTGLGYEAGVRSMNKLLSDTGKKRRAKFLQSVADNNLQHLNLCKSTVQSKEKGLIPAMYNQRVYSAATLHSGRLSLERPQDLSFIPIEMMETPLRDFRVESSNIRSINEDSDPVARTYLKEEDKKREKHEIPKEDWPAIGTRLLDDELIIVASEKNGYKRHCAAPYTYGYRGRLLERYCYLAKKRDQSRDRIFKEQDLRQVEL